MKKTKELLLFLVALFAPVAIFFIVLAFSSVLNSRFVGIENYIRLFLHDKVFGKALLNTFLGPFIFSFLAVSFFAVIIVITRKKIKMPRNAFYITSACIGTITALLYVVYSKMAFLGVPRYLLGYSRTILTISDVLLFLFVGVFTAFIFWVMELIVDTAKSIRNKRDR